MPRTGRASRNTGRDSTYALRSEKTSLIRTSPYTPIDSENGEIRLLELAPGKFDDTIVMRLVPCNIEADDPHVYEALSYVWGTETTSRRAVLDGVPISITANLDSALRHLRLTVVKRTMWIDAISMNQKDIQERNHQVRLMGKIYSTAQRVIVWLGSTDENDMYLRIVLGAMQFHFSEQNPSTVRLFDYICSVVDIMNAQAGRFSESAECVLDALHSVIDRPWFSRIWVVQELALANVALVAIGNYSFPWQMFESFIQWLPHHKLNPETRPQLAVQATRVAKASCDRHFSSQYLRTLHLSASDPRDKIFGILGISGFYGTSIIPDYTKSTKEVILNATVTMLREATLAMYYFMPLQPSRASKSLEVVSGLPSWVPDLLFARAPYTSGKYSLSPGRTSAYHLPDVILDDNIIQCPITALDDMCSLLPFGPAAFSPDLRKLFAPGVLIGTIVETSGELFNGLDGAISITEQAKILQRTYDFVLGPRSIAMVSMIRFLISQDLRGSESSVQRAAIESFESDLHLADIPKDVRAEMENLVIDMVSSVADRILFVTDSHEIGLAYHPNAAHGIRSGDIIGGLFGVSFPFVLRPTDDGQYRMINVARVFGMEWGHVFLGNQEAQSDLQSEEVRRTQQLHRREDLKTATEITWRDYEHHGMREFVIV